MRIAVITVVVLATTGAAYAEDFKVGDYELVEGRDTLDVRKGKQRTILVEDRLVTAAVVDAKKKTVTITYTQMCMFEERKETWTFDQLEARLVNTEALRKHTAKNWKDAAVGFAQAAKLDPKWSIPAYNLASAHNLMGDQPAAIAALAPWLASEPAKTYAQVVADPELRSLLATKELTAMRAATPGTAKHAGKAFGYAYAAAKGLLAYEVEYSDMAACDLNRRKIEIYDVKTGKQVAALVTETLDDSRDVSCIPGETPKNTKAYAARTQARRDTANKVLADLGFVAVKATESATLDPNADKPKASLPKSKLYVVSGDKGTNVFRGKTQIGTGAEWPREVLFFEGANVMVMQGHNPNEGGCPNYTSVVVPLK